MLKMAEYLSEFQVSSFSFHVTGENNRPEGATSAVCSPGKSILLNRKECITSLLIAFQNFLVSGFSVQVSANSFLTTDT